jgi:hypothetical protein
LLTTVKAASYLNISVESLCRLVRRKAISYVAVLAVDDFVIAGSGAVKGVQRCFVKHERRYNEVIALVHQYQDECSLAAVGSEVPRLEGRAPAAMTAQNWFCEIGKYLRGNSKNNYIVPAGTIKPLPEPVLPPWW